MDTKGMTAQIGHEKIQKSESPLRMKNFHFSNIQISFSGERFEHTKMKIEISHANLDVNSARVSVTAEIRSEPDSLHLVLSAEAVFSLDGDGNILDSPLIKQNTVAIMFPFIRSEITLLTSQPGMPPVVIPPLNINKLLSNTQTGSDSENP